MKKNKLRVVIGLLSIMFVAFVGCDDDSFRGLSYNDGVAPGVPTDVRVVNTHGGATIYFKAPLDRDLTTIKATYHINNKEYSKRSSKHVDSLSLVGFGIEGEYTISLTTIDKSQNESESVEVVINPLEPPVQLIQESITSEEAFGGIRIKWDNITESYVIVVVNMRDSLGDWVEIENYYTNSKIGILAVRGIEAIEQEFQVYIRDRWDNYSENVEFKETPIFEEEIDKTKFKEIDPFKGDAVLGAWGGSYPVNKIWTETGDYGCFHTWDNELGSYVTFDMGQKVKLTRFKMWHRREGTSNWLYGRHNLRLYDVYGADEITAEMRTTGDIKHWTLIHEAECYRPSGLPRGTLPTQEDISYILNGDDQEISREAPAFRYMRIHMKQVWDPGSTAVHIARMRFWGEVIE